MVLIIEEDGNLNDLNITSERIGWRFDNTYAQLPENLFDRAKPVAVRAPRLVMLNDSLAAQLGLDFSSVSEQETANIFAGQELPPGSYPLAQAYAGHQFGGFTMLGDGRAILLGEHLTPGGERFDIQLKGAGRTRFSRMGDGLAALGPMLREYIISEALAALGIPTTRSLAVVATGETVYRSAALPGAILTRVAASHIRVGTFEYVAAAGDFASLRILADYTIDRHYPELAGAPERYLELLRAVSERQASLIAQWQLVGFIHGVMNTDNMAVSGETIDYGPCAFMNSYRPDTVFSSIDHSGRYAYSNQPAIAQWNLARFAESLLPLLGSDQQQAVSAATEVLGSFPETFERYWLAGMRKKLGLRTEHEGDASLIHSLLQWMQQTQADFTNTFRDLASIEIPAGEQYRQPAFVEWHARWQHRLSGENQSHDSASALMQAANPAVIPRNHRVEQALSAAQDRDDLSELHGLLNVLATPYQATAEAKPYQEPSPDDDMYQTFCGT